MPKREGCADASRLRWKRWGCRDASGGQKEKDSQHATSGGLPVPLFGKSSIARAVSVVKGLLDKRSVWGYNTDMGNENAAGGSFADILWTTATIAEMAGVDQSFVRRSLRAGRLRGEKLGGRWVIPADEAERWLRTPRKRGRPRKQPGQLEFVQLVDDED
jgi:excisionase family DNA binding protein